MGTLEQVTSGRGIDCYSTLQGTHYYPNDLVPSDGALRTYAGNMQYYNASKTCWQQLQGDTVHVELSMEVHVVLNWVRDKMAEDVRIKDLIEKHPALKKAKENFDIIKVLVENDS
jgi:hypothetical protein